MKAVGQPIRKKDAMALVTGKPVFMDDLASKGLPDRKGTPEARMPMRLRKISKDRCGKKSAGDRRYLHVGRCAA